MNIGLAILLTREQQGLRQGDLARLTGISPTSISQIEHGKQWPTRDNLGKIAAALHVPIGLLYLQGLDREDFSLHQQKRFDIMRPVLKSILEQLT